LEYWETNGLVKGLKRLFSVIPAQAGIQSFEVFRIPLDSRFHGNDLLTKPSRLEEWKSGRVEYWKNGGLEYWKNGILGFETIEE